MTERQKVKIVAFKLHNWDEGKTRHQVPQKNFLFDFSNIIYRIPEEQHQMSKKNETVNEQNKGNTEHLNNEEESQVGIRTWSAYMNQGVHTRGERPFP